jgi:argininosuccinate synthase
MERIVLAFTGGFDTSLAIPWLREKYGMDVVAVSLDLGQVKELADIRERALALGAVRAHVLDVREEFAHEYVLPALQAGALYEHRYPMATSLGRPLIAKHLVRVAEMEGATGIAHGCTGKGNDQVRIEVAARALNQGLRVVAPARESGMTREQEFDYARAHGVPIPLNADSPYNIDSNLWGRSVQSGELEDPWVEPPESIFSITRSLADCAPTPALVEITFARGVPVAINGITMPFIELIASLETMAAAHGVGRLDMVENRIIGIKTREIYEAPAAVVLHAAHRELLSIVVDRDLERLTHDLSVKYADLVYGGLWFTPAREALDAFFASLQRRVTGTIRVKLFKGHCTVVGRSSPHALYDYRLASYGPEDAFDHAASVGFIKIYGLPVEAAARQAPGAVAPQAKGQGV